MMIKDEWRAWRVCVCQDEKGVGALELNKGRKQRIIKKSRTKKDKIKNNNKERMAEPI